MFKEFVHIRQEPGRGRRRWFEADELELVVWFDDAGCVEGYQLCYELRDGERALTWRPGLGFMHSTVDTGDQPEGGNKMTPILVPDGSVPWAELEQRFARNAAALDPELLALVGRTLAARR